MTQDDSGARDTLLSVIIPAYNVEPYIAASLESALSQPFSNKIEFIVVDDGSTDGTMMRILEVMSAYPAMHIKVFHQENRGVSAARNRAISQAKSPYIGFLDSDDIWSTDFTQKIIPLLAQDTADIIEFNVGVINASGKVIDQVKLIEPSTAGHRIGDLRTLLDFARVYQVFPVARVYRRELWNGIEFPAGRVYEDTSAIPLVYTKADSFFRIADILYYYRRRAGSITTRATPYTVMSLASISQDTLERCDGGALDPFWIAVFHKVFNYACFQAARVDANAFAEAISILEQAETSYRIFAANRNDTPKELHYYTDIIIDRRVFLAKRFIKRALGMELTPPKKTADTLATAGNQ